MTVGGAFRNARCDNAEPRFVLQGRRTLRSSTAERCPVKNLVLCASLTVATLAPSLAHAIEPPLYCRYGKVSSSQPEIPAECVAGDPLIRSGAVSLGLCSSPDGFSSSDIDGYLEVDWVPTYIRIGGSLHVKADGEFWGNGNGHDERITFFDSLVGYAGENDTSFEGNAYLEYTISGGPSRPGHVWVINNEYDNVCSMKAVYFQQGPRLTVTAFDERSRMVTLDYEIDRYSRNSVEGAVTSIAITSTSAMTQPFTSKIAVPGTRGTINIQLSPSNLAGLYTFTARLSDGEYDSGDVRIGSITAPCLTGAKKVIQTSPSTAINFDAARFCGASPGGTACRYSVRPLSSYSYPPLEYTCL
jgi:hypothetical protein